MDMEPPVPPVCVFWVDMNFNQKQDPFTDPPDTHIPKSNVPLQATHTVSG